MTEASYETEQLRKMAERLLELTTEYDLAGRAEAVQLVSQAWPSLGMTETPGEYDELCEAVKKATKAVLSMTETLSESIRAIADEYVQQEEEYGKNIESVMKD